LCNTEFRIEIQYYATLGTIAEILPSGAHPIYVVRGERELLIPAIEPFVRSVDLENGVVIVDPPAGLEDL
jgi:16S rRNA processing protein RimM